MISPRPTRAYLLLAATLTSAALLASATPALAAGPALAVHVQAPDTVTPGLPIKIVVVVQNVGSSPLSGSMTVADTFPTQLAITNSDFGACTTVAQTDSCTQSVEGVQPGGEAYIAIVAPVEASALGNFVNSIEVTGGGTTQDLTVTQPMTVGPPGPFQFKAFDPILSTALGAPAVQAGSDPADITTRVSFPSFARSTFGFFRLTAAVEQFKDVTAHLPVGLIGNPTLLPRCTLAELGQLSGPISAEIPTCPDESQVGIVRLGDSDLTPLYNIVAPKGAPAAFAFVYQSVEVILEAKVRPSDNGLDIVALNAVTSVPLASVDVTFWGVPGDPSHDNLRGVCLDGYQGNNGLHCPLVGRP